MAMLEQFPFRIRGFHSDNGSEFINHRVAELLNKLMVRDTMGELATIAGFGSRPQGGNHNRDAGSASARQDRHGGSAGNAEGQAKAICRFSAEEDRLTERVPSPEAAGTGVLPQTPPGEAP